ncbi:hypothetical protein ALC62_02061 [Cyphomyrmex costatus]|uniref:Reverse transcriptase zinc-binding domain-containing protein n=1 Tax=Cyphomyrmex costatus TaxID=456900 RepID=A0A151IND2_9HYME|nr:hypothetical protein ALC62_02061 [Cyphomyrmex costatus]
MVLSPACDCGDSRQDLNHIIFHCPLTRSKAGPLMRYINKKFPSHNHNIFPSLAKPFHSLCRLLLSFFKAIEISV